VSPYVIADRCTGCGSCVEVCPHGAIEVIEGLARIDESRCTDCGACVEACQQGAILERVPVLEGEVVSVEPVEVRVPALREPGTLAVVAGTALSFLARRVLPSVAEGLASTLEERLSGGWPGGGSGRPGPGGRRRRRRRGR
jgi:NAD-dependent dihydropyrimidine dehydrogenase PreA subunit